MGMIKTLAQRVDAAIEPLRALARGAGSALFDLAVRLYLAHAFFASGMLRLNDWRNGNWDSQIFLFDFEHPVPLLAPATAAAVTTVAELALPALLALGLFTRVGAAGVLIMTAVIEFTYTHATEHILWFSVAGMLFIKGPGAASADWLLLRWLRGAGGATTAGPSDPPRPL